VVDQKILAARFYAPSLQRALQPLDKVIVRNLVLDANIGVYSLEYGVTQRVRLSVEIECFPSAKPLEENINNVINYDYVVEGARAIVASGHIQLVETLAERLAAHCLADRRAATVRIYVEKLDRIEGASLGVEIFRRAKPAHEANVYSLMLYAAKAE
jgi:dihydroneopterin aldolase